MQDAITEALRDIESRYGVTILYACESGSRVYGIESANSDYDIRFIYAHPREVYLQLDAPRDVIEEKQDNNVLDIVGWDIFKALRLLRKCNPPLLEWLASPTVYIEPSHAIASIRIYATQCYMSMAVEQHYFHMAQGNYKQYIQGKSPVLRKKYLYVVRPLLTLLHLRQNYETRGDLPPVNMLDLLEGVELPGSVRSHIMRLIKQKQAGDELGMGMPDDILNSFIENMFARMPRFKEQQEAPDLNLVLNAVLKRVLDEASR